MVDEGLAGGSGDAGKAKRNKTIKLSILSSLVSKVVGALIQFGGLPLAMSQLGKDNYAVFIAVGTMASMASTANLGVGPGLIRSLTHYATDPDESEERSWFMSGLFLVSVFAAMLIVLGALFPVFVPLTSVFGAGNPDLSQTVWVAYVVMVFIAVGMNFMSLSEATYVGLLEGYWPKIYYLFGYLLSLLSILGVAFLHPEPWAMVLAFYGVPMIPLGYGAWRLIRGRRYLLGGRADAVREKVLYILRTNLGSTSSQLGELLTFQVGTLMIGGALGAAALGKFGTLFQWFLMASSLRTMVLGPLGATVANAWVKGDDIWLKGALKKAFALVLGTGFLVATGLFLFGSAVTEVLFIRELVVGPEVFRGFAFMVMASFVFSCLMVLVMAFDRFGVAGAVTLVRGVVILGVTSLFIRDIGIEGFYWLTGILMAVSTVVMGWVMRGQLWELYHRMKAVG